MKHYYRLSPVLWDKIPGNYTATVYAIDRIPLGPLASYVKCTSRSQTDPAYWWSGSTFLRLIRPHDLTSSDNTCDAITWQTLMGWLSFAEGLGYKVSEMCALDPNKDITLIYCNE
jgi:hypothetical protein